MATLLKARKTEDSFNLGVTVGIQYVEFGVSGNVESALLTNLTKYTNQVREYVLNNTPETASLYPGNTTVVSPWLRFIPGGYCLQPCFLRSTKGSEREQMDVTSILK